MDKLAKAKSRLVLRQPFIAHLLLGLNLKEDASLNPPTMATDGKTIWYHPDAVEEWSIDECMGLLAHEVMHVASLHPFRRGNREHRKFNHACDYCFVEGTRVTMANGDLKPIEQISIGEYVMTPFGDAKVTNTMSRIADEQVEVVNHIGNKLYCTPDHRFLTEVGYECAEKLSWQGPRCYVDSEHASRVRAASRPDAGEADSRTHGVVPNAGVLTHETYRVGSHTPYNKRRKSEVGRWLDRRRSRVLRWASGWRGHGVMQPAREVHSPVFNNNQYVIRPDVLAKDFRYDRHVSGQQQGERVLENNNIRVWAAGATTAHQAVCEDTHAAVRHTDRDNQREEGFRVSFPADADHARLACGAKGFELARIAVTGRSQTPRRVFDLTTEAHCFVAEGVVVHNCINGIIEEFGLTLPPKRLRSPQYDGKAAEVIYGMMPDPPPNDGGGSGGQPGGGDFDNVRDAEGTSSDKQQAEADMQVKVKQAANMAKAAGKLPASLAKLVDEILEPKVDWRSELRRYMTAVLKTDQSWSRGQRRFLAQGLYLPAFHTPGMGKVSVIIDTSGSVYAEAPAFLDEVRAICEECKPECIEVVQVDARVHEQRVYEVGEPLSAEIKGGGGTDLRKGFDAVTEPPAVLVCLTDLETPFPAVPPEYPVIWCATTKHDVPFGDVIRL